MNCVAFLPHRRFAPRRFAQNPALRRLPRSIPILPEGGLTCGALHEVVPETAGATAGRLRLHRGVPCPHFAATPPPAHLRPAGLWTARAWPALRTWPQRSRSRSGPPDPGRDGAPQRNAVGDGRGVAFGGAAAVAGIDRQARSEDQPKAASRRQRCGPAAVAVAAGANAGSERRGNALARRHGGSRARPFRHVRAPTMASAT